MKKHILQIAIHVIAWTIFLSLPAFFKPNRPGEPSVNVIYDVIYTPRLYHSILLIAIFYFNYYVAIPKLYFRKKNALFLLSFAMCFAILMLLEELVKPDDMRHFTNGMVSLIGPSHNMFMFLNVYALSFALRLYNQWRKERDEKLTTEISFLKAQINPHFLFNTLNSIYSLTITKSDKAPDAVVQLSSLMRYSVTDASSEQVPLSKELNYIRDYISLQRLRLTDNATLRFDIKGESGNMHIAPFILTPFIENAFKYGINTEEQSRIEIDIEITGGKLILKIANDKVYVQKDEYSVSGIGINNSKKRLKYLYPGKHVLNIYDTDDDFTVDLTIDLS